MYRKSAKFQTVKSVIKATLVVFIMLLGLLGYRLYNKFNTDNEENAKQIADALYSIISISKNSHQINKGVNYLAGSNKIEKLIIFSEDNIVASNDYKSLKEDFNKLKKETIGLTNCKDYSVCTTLGFSDGYKHSSTKYQILNHPTLKTVQIYIKKDISSELSKLYLNVEIRT